MQYAIPKSINVVALILSVVTFAGCSRRPLSSTEAKARLGLFIGVDGQTFSEEGRGFRLFEGYFDHESILAVPTAQLELVIARLEKAGISSENEPQLQFVDFQLPLTYRIRLTSQTNDIERIWYHSLNCRGGCQVPVKYLALQHN